MIDAWEDDEWDDGDWEDEAWDEHPDDDDGLDEEQTGPCPKCGAELHVDAESCYACGHWLSTAERHKLWDGGSPVRGAMGVGKFLLVAILLAVMSLYFFA
ncbi:MAG: hypothetical protein AAGD11_18245 [Planctomycetota bacterium]